MARFRESLARKTGTFLGAVLPKRAAVPLISRIMRDNPHAVLEGVLPYFNRAPNLGTLTIDLPTDGPIEFEHLADLFASSSLNHHIISLPIRQGAYLFGLIRHMRAKKVVEIGRYKGGGTLLMAAAMRGEGDLWSIDIGEKVVRVFKGTPQAVYDQQLKTLLDRFGLKAHLIIGDSKTLELDTGNDVDLVFIDGDHTYEGAKIDFERFGRRVRVGGAVLFDDTFNEEFFPTHVDTVGRLVQEIVNQGDFRLVKSVDRLAHLERVR